MSVGRIVKVHVKVACDDKFMRCSGSEKKELNSSRNLEKGTRRLTDGGGR